MTELMAEYYFPSPVYYIDRPDFLSSVTMVSDEYLAKVKSERPLDDIYPVYMSNNF